MATTNLLLKGSKNPSNIYVRFTNTRAIDFMVPTGIFINPAHFDKKNQKIRNLIEIPNRDEINSKLSKLKIHILDEYNFGYMNGIITDKNWLNETVNKFFNRPKGEDKKKNSDHLIYLSSFATWWLDTKAEKFKVKADKYMDERTKAHYTILKNLIIEFEGKNKIQLRNITEEIMDNFAEFLSEKKYAKATAARMISRLKFFCARAEAENIEVNKNYKKRVFVAEEEVDYKHPYLNEDEINVIFKKDLSHDESLSNIRDNFIIGLRTGLRVSDFLTRLSTENLSEDFIEIRTLKTKTWVSVPLHNQVKSILQKRGGLLPPKVSEQEFNRQVKILAQICDIDYEMLGAIIEVDEKTKIKRKKIGMYKKYLLISSHICRRSFATNLFGKIPNSTICALGGWKTEDMMLKYIKQTSRESAMILKNHWEKQV